MDYLRLSYSTAGSLVGDAGKGLLESHMGDGGQGGRGGREAPLHLYPEHIL